MLRLFTGNWHVVRAKSSQMPCPLYFVAPIFSLPELQEFIYREILNPPKSYFFGVKFQISPLDKAFEIPIECMEKEISGLSKGHLRPFT